MYLFPRIAIAEPTEKNSLKKKKSHNFYLFFSYRRYNPKYKSPVSRQNKNSLRVVTLACYPSNVLLFFSTTTGAYFGGFGWREQDNPSQSLASSAKPPHNDQEVYSTQARRRSSLTTLYLSPLFPLRLYGILSFSQRLLKTHVYTQLPSCKLTRDIPSQKK